MFSFSNGRSLDLDTTCTDTYTDTNIHSSPVSVGYAARENEERQRRKYGALGTRFRLEASRSRDSRCVRRVKSSDYIETGRRIINATGGSRETLWLEQMFGLAVQRALSSDG